MPSQAGQVANVLIVTNMREEPYNETISGFKTQISANAKIKITELSMAQVNPTADKEIERLKPDLIFALGGEATKWASSQTYNIPVISTLVFKDGVFKKSANITGVRMYYSLHTQFIRLKIIFNHIKQVAILFNPHENAAFVADARKISQQEGFNLVAIPVETPRDLPFALAQLSHNIQVLLAIPDETVYSVNTINEEFLVSFRDRVPIIGLADNWTRSGAIYSLSWDFADLGRQCAVLANKVLSGISARSIAPEYPRKVTYTINAKIAEHMKIQIPKSILDNAKMVYK